MVKRRLLCPKLPTSSTPALLPEQEAWHARKVLRLRNGDLVEAIDGKGHKTVAKISFQGDVTYLEFVPAEQEESTPDLEQHVKSKEVLPLELQVAVLKADAMEWSIEKAVELGVQSVRPLITDHTVVQTHAKGPEDFQQRWQKIADQALKQCGRLNCLEIHQPIRLKVYLESIMKEPDPGFFLWCDEAAMESSSFLGDWVMEHQKQLQSSRVHLFIGPEGGWSAAERSDLIAYSQRFSSGHFVRVHLGPLVLRAETAVLSSVSVLSAWMRMRSS